MPGDELAAQLERLEASNSPVQTRAASVDTIDLDKRTVRVCWTTGADVVRRNWMTGEKFIERLTVSSKAIDLSRLNNGAPLLDSHSQYSLDGVLGVVERAWIEAGQGWAIVRFGKDERSEIAFQRVAVDKVIRNVSVGYVVNTFEVDRSGPVPIYNAIDWQPSEISLVPVGADAEAGVRSDQFRQAVLSIVESAAIVTGNEPSKRNDEMPTPEEIAAAAAAEDKRLIEVGRAAEAEAATRAAATAAAAGQKPAAPAAAAQPPAATAAAPVIDIARFEALGRAFRKAPNEVIEAMKRGIPADKWGEELINEAAAREAAAPTSGIHFPSNGDELSRKLAGMQEWLEVRAGTAYIKDAKLSQGNQFRGMGLVDLAKEFLRTIDVPIVGQTPDEISRTLFSPMVMIRVAGMHNTADFGNILGQIANKSMKQAYALVPQTYQQWATADTLPDFKIYTRVALSEAPELLLIPEGTEYEYGTMSDRSEQVSLATYGRMFAITRQAIVNDDMGAFTRMPAMWGAAAARLEAKLVYNVLLNNAAMSDSVALFHATHNNLGTAGAISDTTLSEAFTMMESQTNSDGETIVVTPKYLIVGPAKRVEAEKLLTAVAPNQTSQVNLWPGKLTLIVEPRITGNQWFIAADPNAGLDTVTYFRLQGSEAVFVDRKDGWNVDGVEFKARHDFSANAIDYRGLFKNAGN